MNNNYMVDPGIKDLIDAMNGTGVIKTVSCCEGHEGHKYFPKPYIAFYIDSAQIVNLAKALNATVEYFENIYSGSGIYFDASWVCDNQTHGSQDCSPKGYISLSIAIYTPLDIKEIVFDKLKTNLLKYLPCKS